MTTLYSQPVSLTIKTRFGYIQRSLSTIYFTPKQNYTLPEVRMRIKQVIGEKKKEIIEKFRKRMRVLDFMITEGQVNQLKEINVKGESYGYMNAEGALLEDAVVLEI